jgi:hypothetical protein
MDHRTQFVEILAATPPPLWKFLTASLTTKLTCFMFNCSALSGVFKAKGQSQLF